MRTPICCLIIAVSLSACSPEGKAVSDQQYTVTKIGMQEISDRQEYEYIKNVSFTATQKYKFKNESGLDEAHWLVLKVTKMSGDTVLQDTVESWVLIENGEATEDCSHYFSIPLRSEDTVGSLICEFEPLGVLKLDARATLNPHQSPKPAKPEK